MVVSWRPRPRIARRDSGEERSQREWEESRKVELELGVAAWGELWTQRCGQPNAVR